MIALKMRSLTVWPNASIMPTSMHISSIIHSNRCSLTCPNSAIFSAPTFRPSLNAIPPAAGTWNRLLYFKGFHALVTHRFAHELWKVGPQGFRALSAIQSSRIFAVDINPATRIGRGIMLDHGTGIVIGETAVIGDNCSILQSVTLGGNGKETGDRHPKIGKNVLLAAGAKVLGNITVGDCSKVAAGSVVLNDVPANKTVAGVPARIVGDSGCPEPARTMDHRLDPHDCGCGGY